MTSLRFDNVSLSFGSKPALSDLSLDVESGEIMAVLGPSGCGKTSLLRVALGLDAPTRGTVWAGAMRLSADGRILVSPERRRLAMVFQDLALWPHLSVEGHLRFVLSSAGVPRPEQEERIARTLDQVELRERAAAHPGELSGGERQRVAIARALVTEPAAVLLDEPLSNLDLRLRRELLGLLKGLFVQRRMTAVYVTHDIREAVALGDRIAVMNAGRLVAVGSIDELRGSPEPLAREILEGLTWSGL